MNELSKELRVISIRNGVELSVEKDRIDALLPKLEKGGFCQINEEFVNAKDIVGIFTPQAIEGAIRRKNGQWYDSKTARWYEKGTRRCPDCGNILPEGMKCGNCGGR